MSKVKAEPWLHLRWLFSFKDTVAAFDMIVNAKRQLYLKWLPEIAEFTEAPAEPFHCTIDMVTEGGPEKAQKEFDNWIIGLRERDHRIANPKGSIKHSAGQTRRR